MSKVGSPVIWQGYPGWRVALVNQYFHY